MRSIDATLLAALQTGTGKPYATVSVGYMVGNAIYSKPAIRYKLTGTTIEAEIAYTADIGGDQTALWLTRGLTIAATDYPVTTGRFYISSQTYQEDGHQIITGSLFPKQKYTADGAKSYTEVIHDFCTAYGKDDAYIDDTQAWLDYQFLPDGKTIVMNDANHFLNLLAQKYLIFCCDAGDNDVRFYSADVAPAASATITVKDKFDVVVTNLRTRQYLWKDEAGTVHTDGAADDPVHNLGYLESTDSPPTRHAPSVEAKAIIRPDLRFQDGDVLTLSFYGGTTVTFFAQVTEIYEPGSKTDPPWRLVLEANPIFHNTEAGALPSTIERVSNYTPLNTTMFDGVLSTADNNLQAAMDTLDDHTHTHSDVMGCHAGNQTVAAGTTVHTYPFYFGLVAAGPYATPWPKAGVIKNFYVRAIGTQPATGTLTVTVQVNATTTTIVATVPAGAGNGVYSDTTHTYTIAAGDRITFVVQNNAAAGSIALEGITLEISALPTT